MKTSIPFQRSARQPERAGRGARGLRRALLALAAGGLLAGGALLAGVPVGALHAAAAMHAEQASNCPSSTLLCP